MPNNTEAMQRANEARKAKAAAARERAAAEKAEREAAWPRLIEQRNQQLAVIERIIIEINDRLLIATQSQSQHALLTSVLDGLYVEIDKQCKKAPAELITDLGLEQVNDIIRAIKELAKDDPYVQKQKEFVAAGDNPQLRDVIIVLKQLDQGLQREKTPGANRISSLRELLNQARTIEAALRCFIANNETNVTSSIISERGVYNPSDFWFLPNAFPDRRLFNWNKLDSTDLVSYFA